MEMWQLELEIVHRLNPKQRMDSTIYPINQYT